MKVIYNRIKGLKLRIIKGIHNKGAYLGFNIVGYLDGRQFHYAYVFTTKTMKLHNLSKGI